MRIGQVSPLYESVPPACYGGTERIVSYLTEELVRQGHQVTLFASGDSVTRAQLRSPCRKALRLDEDSIDMIAPHILELEMVHQEAGNFDLIHYHIDYLHFPLSRRSSQVQVTTLHGRLNVPELQPLYREFREMPLVSISDEQRRPLAWANWVATVSHGLPADLYSLSEPEGKYLAFLGRISPEKRLDHAIEIAKAVGLPLRVAAKIDKADQAYFQTHIRHLLHNPLIEFIGEVSQQEKGAFLGNALALLFPIDWAEPFGLVMIEALACGTPVIAYDRGSVPEVIDHGMTGFIVNSQQEAAKAVNQLHRISRKKCRLVFEQRFSAVRMANDYLAVYQQLLDAGPVHRAKKPA
jgi:glycosyltransferase involved in cell wall biosynthesis